jgi:hypothetical protein
MLWVVVSGEENVNEALRNGFPGNSMFLSENKTGNGPLNHLVYTRKGLRGCIVEFGDNTRNANC